jgi:hypothetical protein
MTTIPRNSSELVQISRAEQRKQRLRELETEQAAEEAEALKMTEEQRQTLLKSFTSVKVEFTDLDGLRWSQTALRRFPPFHINTPNISSTSHATSKNNTFVVLTNADLANFSAEDTIRVSTSSSKMRPPYPIQKTATPHLPSVLPQSSPPQHDDNRSRSSIEGLFQSESSHQGSDSSIHPIDMPYFESSDSSDGNVVPVADDGFVNKQKQGIVSRGRRKRMGPPGLLSIDPSASQAALNAAGPKVPDLLKERITHCQQSSSITATHDLLTDLTAFVPKDSLYHSPASPILSKSSSFVQPEPPYSVYSPQDARVRLHSILNGTVPTRPVPLPVDPDTTPSPFLLSSSTFWGGRGEDPPGDVSEDDETPTTSPMRETGGNWIH